MAKIDKRRRKGDRHKVKRKGDRHKRDDLGRRVRAKTKPPAPFLAIDGEGWDVDERGRQFYQVMVAANDCERYVLDTGAPLTTADVLAWIDALPKGRILISFSFGYDVTMLLRDLPDKKKYDLCRRAERPLISHGFRKGQPRPVYHGSYRLDWLPRKFFSVNSKTIYDVWAFSGKSFLSTLKDWNVATPEEFALIESGKARRTDDGDHDRATEAEYSILECRTLCRVMDKIRSLCRNLGYPLRDYFGAGSVASAILTKHEIPSYIGELPKGVIDPAQRAFFGGRFETARLGEVQNVYYYDIVSAYPSIIRNLPCLAHGRWKRVRKYDPKATCAVWHVKWDADTIDWAPFPWRDEHGGIKYPGTGEGWYWQDEVRVAREHFTPRTRKITKKESHHRFIDVLGGWVWVQSCDHRPFGFVDDLFAQRAEYKSQKRAEQLVIKLGLNSLYGKAAQSVGGAKFASPVWAGMITSGTRAVLLSAIMQAPEHVFSTATDSVSSLVPLDLPIGKALGEWENEFIPAMFFAGDGMSWDYTPDVLQAKRTRTRGIGAKEIVWQRMLDAWRERGFDGRAKFRVTRFEGLKLMAGRGKPDDAGVWRVVEREICFLSNKRMRGGNVPGKHNTYVWPWSFGEGDHACSAPYSKTIGAGLLTSEDQDEQDDAKDVGGGLLEMEAI